jgi:MFS superfamily sulfate permease-like transporter
VPVPDGLLVKVSTTIFWVPLLIVWFAGREIEYVAPSNPVTVNAAAVMVPAIEGEVRPLRVRVPAGTRTTVPPSVSAMMLPKLMLAVWVIVIGDTITAVAVAVAEDCANAPAVNASRTTENARIFFISPFFNLID